MDPGKQPPAGAQAVGEILPGLIRRLRPSGEEDTVRLLGLWEAAVGAETARHARPAAFRGSRLVVHVSSSSWLHHLHLRRAELIEAVNRCLGKRAIREIILRIGPCGT